MVKSTHSFGPRSPKLAPDFNFPKILTVIGSFCVPARNDRETALFSEEKNGYEVRDGVKKSKWKFKMAFAMKRGGLEGVSSATYLF